MSGIEIIELIQALPEVERREVLLRVEQVFGDDLDCIAADEALKRNDFVDWESAKSELPRL